MSKEPRIEISKEGIQLLVFANENENQYKAGIQKSLKFFEIKIDSIQSAIQKFWYMNSIQAMSDIVHQPFFIAVCIYHNE